MDCVRCESRRQNVPVRDKAELEALFLSLRKDLVSGALRELRLPFQYKKPLGFGFVLLVKLWPAAARWIMENNGRYLLSQVSGPTWPDYFECRFKCSQCGTKFKLHIETYHGSGGAWEVVT